VEYECLTEEKFEVLLPDASNQREDLIASSFSESFNHFTEFCGMVYIPVI